jgi:hypothetical protein
MPRVLSESGDISLSITERAGRIARAFAALLPTIMMDALEELYRLSLWASSTTLGAAIHIPIAILCSWNIASSGRGGSAGVCGCGPRLMAGFQSTSYTVTHVYPHDPSAFTRGLFYHEASYSKARLGWPIGGLPTILSTYKPLGVCRSAPMRRRV